MDKSNKEMSGWVGWAAFAGVLLILQGFFASIVGFVALFQPEVYVVGANNILAIDLNAWGWYHLAIGLLILLAGLSVLKGNMYGRIVGIVLAVVYACANLVFIPYQPIWSVILIVVSVCIIYALLVHGGDIKEA